MLGRRRSRISFSVKLELVQLADCPDAPDGRRDLDLRPVVEPEAPVSRGGVRAVPFTVVALADGVPVGSCLVIDNDCVHRPQLTPWVAAVFVKPESRGRGVASAILEEAATIATRSGSPASTATAG